MYHTSTKRGSRSRAVSATRQGSDRGRIQERPPEDQVDLRTNQLKQGQRRPNEWCYGSIVDVQKRLCIQPHDALNSKLLHFDFKKVKGPHVKVGDQVRFKVDENNTVDVLCLLERRQGEEKSTFENTEENEQLLQDINQERNSARPKPLLSKQKSLQPKFSSVSKTGYLQGRLISVKETMAYIKPLSKLPSDYVQNNVIVKVAHIRSAKMKVIVGDFIQFVLSAQDKNKPMAFHPSVVRFQGRLETELVDYMKTAMELLEPHNSDEEEVLEITGSCQKKSSTEFLIELLNLTSVWSCLGSNPEMTLDTTKLLFNMTLIVESLSESMRESFRSSLNSLMQSKLFSMPGIKMMIKEVVQSGDKNTVTLFRNFFSLVFKYLPEQAASALALVKPMISNRGVVGSDEAFLFSALKHVSKILCQKTTALEWDDIPLIPTGEELLAAGNIDYKFLSPITKTYSSAEEYLETNFTLLRADCFDSLKKGIRALVSGRQDSRDMNVYVNVSLAGINVTGSGTGLEVLLHFTSVREVKDWKTTSKLMYGNLLCISPSGSFQDIVLAVVAVRDVQLLQKEQIICIELCGSATGLNNEAALISLTYCSGRMIMVECPTYYRAYQPTLNALQMKQPDKLPFVEQLVKGDRSANTLPQYINEEELIAAESLVIDHLDIHQEHALKYAFRNNVACIQGPPGTGKTYIGIQIVKTLLSMKCCPNSPILVITYKNHVLNEFLKEIHRIEPDMVARIGGRLMDADFGERNLLSLARKRGRSQAATQAISDVQREMDKLKTVIKENAKNFVKSRYVTLSTLTEFLHVDQLASLLRGAHPELHSQSISTICKAFVTATASEKAINLLKTAFSDWCPSQELIKHMEDHYSKNITIEPKTDLNELSELNNEADFLDEKDIEDIEKLRQTDGGRNKMDMSDLFFFTKGVTLVPEVKLIVDEKSFDSVMPFFKMMTVKNIWSLSEVERFMLLQYLLVKQSSNCAEKLETELHEYHMQCTWKKELNNQHKAEVLSSMKVIGATVTGASINQDILMQVKPAIIIVEEAAEVLEAHLIATLGPWVEHLIMIGDHQQLRPPVESYRLQKDFNFDLSMMERLIQCKLPYSTLNQQNRMLPEIADLLHDIYPCLDSNLDRVQKNSKPPSLEKCMFFWTHTNEETKTRSYFNENEAHRAVNLALFLVEQGHDPSTITILSPYQGQVALLRRLMRAAMNEWKQIFEKHSQENTASDERKNMIAIHTIDLYQGDENDIVIVSLVRSNKQKNSGFLKLINRRCVAQSRAKSGMYMIGNADTLRKEDHWDRFIQAMSLKNCVGDSIILQCSKHHAVKVNAKTAEDIPLCKEFCKEKCCQILGCRKHYCKKYCQPPHDHDRCKEQCIEVLPCSHSCPKGCFPPHDHNICTELVEYKCSKCHNAGYKLCSETEAEIQCQAKVTFEFPCKHLGVKKCCEDESEKKCMKNCTKTLTCGHRCDMKCSEPCNHDSCETCKKIREAEEERKQELEKKRKQEEIEEAIKEAKRRIDEIEASKNQELELLPLLDHSDSAAEYDIVKHLMLAGVPFSAEGEVEIREVKKIICPEIEKECLRKKNKLHDPRLSALKFWKAPNSVFEGIENAGFKCKPWKGQYGFGVYVSSNLTEFKVNKENTHHRVVIVEALLGRVREHKPSSKVTLDQLIDRSYDSVYTKDMIVERHHVVDEFAFPSPHQIIPRYLVYYVVRASLTNTANNRLELEALTGRITEVVKYKLSPSREQRQNDPLMNEFRLVESQFHHLLNCADDDLKYTNINGPWKVDYVDYYINPKLLKAFSEMREHLMRERGQEYGNYILAFHGTKKENIKMIVEENFDPKRLSTGSGDKGWYGAGIYLSEYPQTSLIYGEALILCRVLPGKSFEMNTKEIRLGGPLQKGYDSHCINIQDGGYGEELVIFNPDQILPCYVIHYSKILRTFRKHEKPKNKKGKNKKKP